MQLEKPVVELIQNVLNVARLLKLENVAIESEQIRAMNDSRTIMIQERDVPDLPFEALGVGRVNVLHSRLSLLEGDNMEIEATLLPNNMVRQLDIKSKTAKFEFRCVNTNAIKAPKKPKDTDPATYSVKFNEKSLNMLAKAYASMATEFVNIRSNSQGEITFSIEDSSNDKFTMKFDGDVENLIEDDDDASLDFNYYYKIDMFLTAMKNSDFDKNGDIVVVISQIGGIRTVLNKLTVHIIPSDPDATN